MLLLLTGESRRSASRSPAGEHGVTSEENGGSMTTKDAARIGITLLGLYAVVAALGQLHFAGLIVLSAGELADSRSIWFPVALAGASLAFTAGLGAFLLVRADRLAAKLFGDIADGDDQEERIDTVGAQAVAFSVLGLFLVLTSLPGVFQSLSQLAAVMGQAGAQMLKTQLPRIIAQFLKLILGGVLFFQARRLAQLWHRAQRLGTEREAVR